MQVQSIGGRSAGKLDAARQRDERLRLVHLRLQSRTRDRGERAVAAVRAIRRSAIGQGDSRPADQQVQGLWLRHHDELRGGGSCHSEPQRLHPWQPSAPGELQDQQEQDCVGRECSCRRRRRLPSTTSSATNNDAATTAAAIAGSTVLSKAQSSKQQSVLEDRQQYHHTPAGLKAAPAATAHQSQSSGARATATASAALAARRAECHTHREIAAWLAWGSRARFIQRA